MSDYKEVSGAELFKTGGGLSVAAALAEEFPERLIGRTFNGYRLEALLGQGGMGLVYRAVRTDGEFERTVALKVVTNGLSFARFQREREIHAQLNHPNIARLYDAGTSPEGVPFIIMELVHGQPIDAYCRIQQVALEQRVRLLAKVVEAVAFAHANLIVHRDIKPSNILVDEAGVPKLLDFGIAKITESEEAELTGTARPLTPIYASPEQVLGHAVSIASDIYQLGALIAQVCTDRAPFKDTTLAGAINRAEQDFAPLQNEVRSTLPPDLLAIVMHCLAPDPSRRYADANALAADLIRFLGGYPVLAKNPGFAMRLHKLVRRHPWVTAAATAVVIGGLAGNYWYTAQLTRSNERAQAATTEAVLQRNQAEAEAETNRQVTQFLVGLFKSSDPIVGDDEMLTAAQLLERGVASIDSLNDQPQVQAALQRTMGEVYTTMGRFAEALPLMQEALTNSLSYQQRLRSSIALATVYRELGKYTEGITLLEPLVAELDQRASEHDARDAYAARYQLVLLYTEKGAYDKAPVLLDRLVADAGLVSIGQHINTLLEQASLTDKLGDWRLAEQIYHQAIELEHDHAGAHSHKIGQAYQNLGNLYAFRNRLDEAIAAYQSALQIFEQVYGPEHPLAGGALGSLGSVAWRRNELEDAAGYFQRAVEILAVSRGAEHPDTAKGYGSMGLVYLDLGEYDKAEDALRRTNEIFERHYDPDSLNITRSRSFLAKAYQAKGEHAKAEELLRKSLAVRRRLLPPDNLPLLDTAYALLNSLKAQGKQAAAAALEAEFDFAPLHEALAKNAQ